jgi:hypothetical protein
MNHHARRLVEREQVFVFVRTSSMPAHRSSDAAGRRLAVSVN